MLWPLFISTIGLTVFYGTSYYNDAWDFLQVIWTKCHGLFGGDPYSLNIYGFAIVMSVVFLGTTGIFLLVDITGKPKSLIQYKMQEGKNVPLKVKDLQKCVLVALFNVYVVGYPVQYLFHCAYTLRGNDNGPVLPSLPTAGAQILICVAMSEIGFYYIHRFLHKPNIYKHIHKMHHEWSAPISISALYAHPIEHALLNLFPMGIGPLVVGCHITVNWLWYMLGLSVTIMQHSGYHLPFTLSGEDHDFHHAKFKDNYAFLGIMDWLHGTQSHFRKAKAFDRHRVLVGLTPANILYPDDHIKTCKTE